MCKILPGGALCMAVFIQLYVHFSMQYERLSMQYKVLSMQYERLEKPEKEKREIIPLNLS
ncbi:MAG: hypothetical protein JJE25_09285 [Bacteroidia bacterium]|nr:hypothetical protein [Bacteroidia bacterium]